MVGGGVGGGDGVSASQPQIHPPLSIWAVHGCDFGVWCEGQYRSPRRGRVVDVPRPDFQQPVLSQTRRLLRAVCYLVPVAAVERHRLPSDVSRLSEIVKRGRSLTPFGRRQPVPRRAARPPVHSPLVP